MRIVIDMKYVIKVFNTKAGNKVPYKTPVQDLSLTQLGRLGKQLSSGPNSSNLVTFVPLTSGATKTIRYRGGEELGALIIPKKKTRKKVAV